MQPRSEPRAQPSLWNATNFAIYNNKVNTHPSAVYREWYRILVANIKRITLIDADGKRFNLDGNAFWFETLVFKNTSFISQDEISNISPKRAVGGLTKAPTITTSALPDFKESEQIVCLYVTTWIGDVALQRTLVDSGAVIELINPRVVEKLS